MVGRSPAPPHVCSVGLGQLLVWEWQSESYVLKQQGHFNSMVSLAYSPDGQYIVTGGDDGKVGLVRWPGPWPGAGRTWGLVCWLGHRGLAQPGRPRLQLRGSARNSRARPAPSGLVGRGSQMTRGRLAVSLSLARIPAHVYPLVRGGSRGMWVCVHPRVTQAPQTSTFPHVEAAERQGADGVSRLGGHTVECAHVCVCVVLSWCQPPSPHCRSRCGTPSVASASSLLRSTRVGSPA